MAVGWPEHIYSAGVIYPSFLPLLTHSKGAYIYIKHIELPGLLFRRKMGIYVRYFMGMNGTMA